MCGHRLRGREFIKVIIKGKVKGKRGKGQSEIAFSKQRLTQN